MQGNTILDATTTGRAQTTLHDDIFSRYIREMILNDQPMPAMKKRLMIAATILGAFGGIGYAQPAFDAGETISGDELGYFFAGCTLLSYGSGAIWGLTTNIEKLYPKSPLENALTKNKTTYSLPTHVLSNILGILVSLIPAYTAYAYNKNIFIKLFGACLSFLVSFNFNIFGFYTLADVMKPSNIKNHFSKIRGIASKNDPSQTPALPSPTQNLMMKLYLAKIAINNSEHRAVEKLNSDYFNPEADPKQLINKLSGLAEGVTITDYSEKLYIVKLISIIIPLAYTTTTAFLSYQASRLAFKNDLFTAVFLVLTVTPFFFLQTYVQLGGVGAVSSAFANKLGKNPDANMFSKNFPAYNHLINSTCFLLALFSSSQGAYIAYTAIETPVLNWIVTGITILATVLFEGFILSTITKLPLLHLIGEHSSNSIYKKLINIEGKLDKLMGVLSMMDPNDLIAFQGSDSDDDNDAIPALSNEHSPLLIDAERRTGLTSRSRDGSSSSTDPTLFGGSINPDDGALSADDGRSSFRMDGMA